MSRPALKPVARLSVTFLVDNTIEWMSKLPPGFTHELPRHVPQIPPDEKLGVPVLNFDNFCCGAHGFSALLETEEASGTESPVLDSKTHLTLFDTGPDSQSLVRNIRGLQIPITKIERVIASHWHSDHTGGLLSFLDLRNQCEKQGITTPIAEDNHSTPFNEGENTQTEGIHPCIVDVHPSRPIARGIAPPSLGAVLCAIPLDPSFEEISARGGILEKHKEGHLVAGDTVYISGEIPRVTDFEGGLLAGVRWVEDNAGRGSWEDEPHLMDERYAAVDVIGKGLIIFSACSHAGIVNVVKDAVKKLGRPVYMIAGGLHLASSDHHYRIEPTVQFLSKSLRPAPTYILPMHCTGWKAKVALEQELGEGIVPAGVGHKVDIMASEELGERMNIDIIVDRLTEPPVS